jgi:hypothetical protein
MTRKVLSPLLGILIASAYFPSASAMDTPLSVGPGSLQHLEIASLEPPTMEPDEILRERQSFERQPLNITSERPSTSAILLGGANSAGKFGSFFTTDVFVMNPHPSTTLKINIYLLAQDKDNIANPPPGGSFTLNSLQWTILRNVGAQLGASGGFAILLGVDSVFSSGISRTMSAWAYTSTAGPTGGKYGVNIHGIGNVYQDSLFDGWCVGAEVSSTARTNIGVFNQSSSSTLTVTAKVYGPQGGLPLMSIPLSVPPASFKQVALSSYLSSLIDGVIWFDAASGSYASYMVVNDNVTNDANFQLSTGW